MSPLLKPGTSYVANRALTVRASAERTANSVAQEASALLHAYAPVDIHGPPHRLRSNIAVVQPVQGGAGDIAFGVGPASLMGDPSLKAPPGTIADFLAWYKSHRTTTKGTKGQKRSRTTIGWATLGYFDPKMAWWYLSRKQKAVLRQQRLSGMFGDIGLPIYWYQQEFGLAEVGIRPQGYIERARQDLRGMFALLVEKGMAP